MLLELVCVPGSHWWVLSIIRFVCKSIFLASQNFCNSKRLQVKTFAKVCSMDSRPPEGQVPSSRILEPPQTATNITHKSGGVADTAAGGPRHWEALKLKVYSIQKVSNPKVLSSKSSEFQKFWAPKVLSSKRVEFQKFWVPKVSSSKSFDFQSFWVLTRPTTNDSVHDFFAWCFCTMVCAYTQSAQSAAQIKIYKQRCLHSLHYKTRLTSKTLGLYWSPPPQTNYRQCHTQ